MPNSMPNVYRYSDFRHYLTDLLQFKKESETAGFTYEQFATFCGFDSEAGVRHLLVGRRSLTKPRLARMANTLPLSRAEREYFLDLVRWNQADTITDTVYYFDRLSKHLMRFYMSELGGGRAELLLTRWYYIVIREMAVLEHFRPEGDWISRKLGKMVTPEEAAEALTMLIDNQFLRKEGDRFVATDKNIKLESGIAQRMLDALHVQSICTSLKAVKDLEPADREIHSVTLSLSQEGFDKLRQYLRDCLCSFIAEANRETAPKHICQCNLQFLKLTRSGE